MKGSVKIHFLGASGTVTGSRFLLELPEKTILVDCGMFQGIKKLRDLNWQQLPVKPEKIDLVLLTHGHLDHTGSLPRLVNMGYRGPVWGTSPTLDITKTILYDSAKIQEEEAERANKEGFTKHHPAKPLYNTADVEKTLPLFESKPEGEWMKADDNIRLRFQYNGHILGAVFIELDISGKRIVFSGDIGRKNDPLLFDPKRPEQADILFLESTYGDRLHPEADMLDKLQKIIDQTIQNNGSLIIPSFAVERAQLLMYMIWQLSRDNRIPQSLPVILDSPMGINALSIFRKHHNWHKLTDEQCKEMCSRVHMVQSFKETREIIDNPQPRIVIAGSGMITGGRVLSYLQQYIQKPETTVLLAGYQAEGTRGRQLLEGSPEIKFFGKYYPVRAHVDILQGLSGHADQQELISWVSEIHKPPEQAFLIHGEPQALDMMRVKLKDTYGWTPEIPDLFDIKELIL
jgi:metallo-beta-lactamase family protein